MKCLEKNSQYMIQYIGDSLSSHTRHFNYPHQNSSNLFFPIPDKPRWLNRPVCRQGGGIHLVMTDLDRLDSLYVWAATALNVVDESKVTSVTNYLKE